MLIGTGVRFSRGLVALWAGPAVSVVLALLASRRAPLDTRRRIDQIASLITAAYAIGIIAITLYPFHFDIEPGRIFDRGNWVPFGGTLGFMTSDNPLRVEVGTRDFFANIALFAPIGLVLGARARGVRDVLVIGVLLVLMAFALEVVQGLTVSERTLDIDDAIAGSVGGVCALALGWVLLPDTTARESGYA